MLCSAFSVSPAPLCLCIQTPGGGVGGGWVCTSAKVEGKQAHDKSLTFVWTIILLQGQWQNIIVHWGANKARLWYVWRHWSSPYFLLICVVQNYKFPLMTFFFCLCKNLSTGLYFVYYGRRARMEVLQGGVCFWFVRLRGCVVLLQHRFEPQPPATPPGATTHAHTHTHTRHWHYCQKARPDMVHKSSMTHRLTYYTAALSCTHRNIHTHLGQCNAASKL